MQLQRPRPTEGGPGGQGRAATLDTNTGCVEPPSALAHVYNKHYTWRMPLHLANTLDLPDDGATQTYAFIARKGGGKTYAAGKLVEELLALRVPVVILDPVGNWYGLQIGRDGKSPGFAIPVFGGARGAVPPSAEQGDALARLIVTRHLAAVVDVSTFRKNDRKRFVTDFAESLFHAGKSSPVPRTIVFEEAQVFAPQRAERGGERLLGAVEDIVRLGRNYGLGTVLISQRPQSVNKEVLNQVEALFVGQLSGPQERKAIADWVAERGADRRLLDELPGLPTGTMMVWSPQWLRIFKKVRIARKRTFDASATPELGAKTHHKPVAAASIDAVELRSALSSMESRPAAVERQKRANTKQSRVPHEAEGRIAQLEAELARLRPLEAQNARILTLCASLQQRLRSLQQLATEIERTCAPSLPTASNTETPKPAPARIAPSASRPRHTTQERPEATTLRAGAMRMLTALATFYPGMMTRAQIARAAGMRVTSGTFATYWSQLKQQQFLEEASGGFYRATEVGLNALGSSRPAAPRTFAERKAFWDTRLRAGERRLLEQVIDADHVGVTRSELADAVGMSPTSGTFATYLSTLTNNMLIGRKGDRLHVHSWLQHGPSAT
jgi:uncharacterized protein